MKMLIHRTRLSGVSDPVSLLSVKAHCRIDYAEDDGLIADMIQAAMEDIEDQAQIAVLTQTIRVTIFEPGRSGGYLDLPVGPALQPEAVTVTLDGEPFTGFEVITGNRPSIRWLASYPDISPSRLQVEYLAGFGATAQHVPKDLQLAITDQVALMYEARGQMDPKALTTSPQMARVAARYRGLRA